MTGTSATVVATIEARMTSSRLPGKVMLEAAGHPMLWHLVQRLRAVPQIQEICIATTTNGADDLLAEFASEHGVRCHRGSEDDVLQRVLDAARSVGAGTIVEITGDCPIIDPEIVEQVIETYRANDCDYAANVHVRSYPDGMDTQVFDVETLARSAAMTDDPLDREHVSLHIRNHADLFRPVHIVAPRSCRWPELGLTLDESEDFDLLRNVIEHFLPQQPLFSCSQVVELLRDKPEWVDLNKHVQRKGDA